MFANVVFMADLLLMSTTSAIIDIVALCIVVLLVVLGFKKGFAKTFVSAFGSLLSLLIAILLCTSVASFLESHWGAVSSLSNSLSGFFSKTFGAELMDTTLAQANENALTEGNVAAWIIRLVIAAKNDGSFDPNTTLNQIITPIFSFYVVAIISAVALYIVFRIIFFLIGELIKKAHVLPLVGIVDRLLGALLGLIRAVTYVSLLVWIINILPIGYVQTVIAPEVSNTILVSFLNKINLFELLLGALGKLNVLEVLKSLIPA